MYLHVNAWPYMDHVLVTLASQDDPTDHHHFYVPAHLTRDVYLPSTGYAHVDLLNAVGFVIADLVKEIYDGADVLRADHVMPDVHLVEAAEQGGPRVAPPDPAGAPPWLKPVE